MTLPLPPGLSGVVSPDGLAPEEELSGYAVDGLTPRAVIRPESREAVAEILAWADSEGLRVSPRGGGTQAGLGNAAAGLDIVLDLTRLDRVLDYEPADLTATVEAGITLQAFQRELAQGGKMAGLEAPLWDRATVGGVISVNASGPLRRSYGLPRDSLIGIAVVGPDGTETRAGGRVVKNVTGYDLNKLYAGSLGSLGIIVEASFKLATLPAESGAVTGSFVSIDAAAAAAGDLLHQVYGPQGVHVVNASAARHMGIGSEGLDGGGYESGLVIAYASGRARAVQRVLSQSAQLLREHGGSDVSVLPRSEASDLLREHTDLGWRPDDMPRLSVKLNLPPASVADALSELPNLAGPEQPAILADPGFGTVRMLWREGDDDGERDAATVGGLREMAVSLGGSAVVEHCPVELKTRIDVWGDFPNEAEIMRRIKHNLDSKGTLNPGRCMGKL